MQDAEPNRDRTCARSRPVDVSQPTLIAMLVQKPSVKPIVPHAVADGEGRSNGAASIQPAPVTVVLRRLAALLARVAASEHRAARENPLGSQASDREISSQARTHRDGMPPTKSTQ